MANIDLLQRTMDKINSGEVVWKQWNWNHCFAGNALREAGIEHEGYSTIPDHAQEVLDLTDEERIELFRATNNKENLTSIVSKIISNQIKFEAEVMSLNGNAAAAV